jgi:hypothetical protein
MDIIVLIAGKFFFPLRKKLKLVAENYSPDLLQKIIYAAIHSSTSFENAQDNLLTLAEIAISTSQIQRLTIRITKEFDLQDCKESTNWDKECSNDKGNEIIEVAAISIDGGRTQIREEHQGGGVHNPSWIETKAACLQILKSSECRDDPHPQLPKIFSDKNSVKHLVEGLKGYGNKEDQDKKPPREENKNILLNNIVLQKPENDSSKPEVIKQYVFADIDNAESFGHSVYHKSNQFHLNSAQRKAFIADGDKKIWAIFEENFKEDDWIPILDFVHAVEYAFEAAKLSSKNETLCWAKYIEFISHIWQGKVLTVIRRIDKSIAILQNAANNNPDKSNNIIIALQSIRLYFQNNLLRMDYPEYRKMGLPISSCYVESLIKQFNIRIKSTEKFWNRSSVKAVIKMKASILSDDNYYQKFWNERYDNQVKLKRHYRESQLREAA